MPAQKCVFNNQWRSKYSWVTDVKNDRNKALCVICTKKIELGKMGESALRSHEKCSKHVSNVKSNKTQTSLVDMSLKTQCAAVGDEKPSCSTSTSSNESETSIQQCSTTNHSNLLTNFVSKTDALKAEILWVLQTVSTHSSYRSNEKSSMLFQRMFPDSKIASGFTCGEKKTAYMCVFGIAEYIKGLLTKEIHESQHFVIMFDESLNKKLQSKQMDFHIRYWQDSQICTKYYTSKFLGHGTAEDMISHFMEGVNDFVKDFDKLLQISMDGPSVNWKFYDKLKQKIKDDHDVTLINIGSCGLHVVHNAFKTGFEETSWDISSLLSSMYYLFKDCPARREDFSTVTGSDKFPLKFVSHRWLENVPVCERAIEIWNNTKTYISKTEAKVVTKPSNKSYEVVSKCTKDKLVNAKLEYFLFIAKHLHKFLCDFQTEKPVVPFLYTDLKNVIMSLLKTVLKEETLETVNVSALDLNDDKTYLTYSKIDIGFSAEKALKEARQKFQLSDRQIMEFRIQCRNCVIKLVKKLMDKSPVAYSLTKNLSALNPNLMVSNKTLCINRFKKVLAHLVGLNRLKEREVDTCMQEYTAFLSQIPSIGSDTFANFNPNSDDEFERLDVFFSTYMASKPGFTNAFNIIKTLLILSHGQACVERGFSINKKIEVENMKEETVIAQRLICDHVNAAGSVLNVKMPTELIRCAQSARQKYSDYLEKEKERKLNESRKRKNLDIEDEIQTLRKKLKQAQADKEQLTSNADKYADKAEKEGNLSHISLSNSLRKKAKEKSELIKDLNKVITDKTTQL